MAGAQTEGPAKGAARPLRAVRRRCGPPRPTAAHFKKFLKRSGARDDKHPLPPNLREKAGFVLAGKRGKCPDVGADIRANLTYFGRDFGSLTVRLGLALPRYRGA